jgi:hypothetical protein
MTTENKTIEHAAKDRKEPTYLFSEKQVAEKSELARCFLDARTRLNENVDQADNFLVKRFYNLDHNTYLEGALPAKYKELMGRLRRGAGIRRRNMLTPVKRFQTAAKFLVEPGKPDRPGMIMLFKEPERFPDYLACGVVAARFQLALTNFSSSVVRETFIIFNTLASIS